MITDAERRHRLVERHHLGRTATNGSIAIGGVTAMHSSDPVTPYLGLWARVEGFRRPDLDSLLYVQRSVWRLHAMRRTLFVVPTEQAGMFLAGAGLAVHRKERKRLEGWLARDLGDDAGRWLAEATARLETLLADGREWSTRDIPSAAPELQRTVKAGSGRWVAETPVISRLLLLLAMEGRVVRTRPAGSWRASSYRWANTSHWFGSPPESWDERAARGRILDAYLLRHGPATMTDIRWWTGWTARDTRTALTDLGAVEVELESNATGYVSPADPGSGGATDAVALLPGLDPTPMGWKERDWYLGRHAASLFDRNGNAGPMIWAGGRAVGGWGQHRDGRVAYELLEDVDARTRQRIDDEVDRLDEWLEGEVVSLRFPTPLARQIAAG